MPCSLYEIASSRPSCSSSLVVLTLSRTGLAFGCATSSCTSRPASSPCSLCSHSTWKTSSKTARTAPRGSFFSSTARRASRSPTAAPFSSSLTRQRRRSSCSPTSSQGSFSCLRPSFCS
eukprot:Rmarinus@m.14212